MSVFVNISVYRLDYGGFTYFCLRGILAHLLELLVFQDETAIETRMPK